MSDGWSMLGYALGQRAKQKKFEGLQGQLEQSKQDISSIKNQESDLRKGLDIANKSDDYNMTGKEVYGKQLSDIQSQAQTQQNRPYDILQKMAQVNPEATERYLQIEGYKQNQIAQEQQKQAQLQQKQTSRAAQMAGTILRLPDADRKEAYQFYLNKAQQEGLDVSDMPEQFNSEAEYKLMDLQDRARENENIYKGMLDEQKQADVVNQQNISNQGTVWEREKFGREQANKQKSENKLGLSDATKLSALMVGKKNLASYEEGVFNSDGTLNRKLIAAINTPGARRLGRASDLNAKITNALAAKLRIETGAAITPQEVEEEKIKYLPLVTDDEQTARNKIANLRQIMDDVENQFSQVGFIKNPMKADKQTSQQKSFSQDEVQAELQRRGLK